MDALAGWPSRFMVACECFWILLMAREYKEIQSKINVVI
jgi:hypothetical protein